MIIALTETWSTSPKRLVSISDKRVTVIASNTTFEYNHFFEVNAIHRIVDQNISPKEALAIIKEKKIDYESYRPDSETSQLLVNNANKEIEFLMRQFSL